MAQERPGLVNRVRDHRERRGWSQGELARRAGLSRAGVSAIETGRLVPSAAAALALARTFGCRVEDLFSLPDVPAGVTEWAWPPERRPSRYWRAEVGGAERLYPVEAGPLGVFPHDGVADDPGASESGGVHDPSATLVMACCDPAVGLLAAELARSDGVRLIAVPRSSRAALELMGRGLVHVAGVHLGRSDEGDGNAAVVREALGPGYTLLSAAGWEEGVAFDPSRRFGTVGEALRSGLRWVGREAGSGARQCLDELLGDGPAREGLPLARDQRGVAEAVRAGWADAGVCLRLAGEEAGLGFLAVRSEAYDLCFPASLRDDRRIRALVRAVQSASYRRLAGELPGYDTRDTGEVRDAL
jgi:molybdate-binding protein/DNA-binding XRE family transcriptional regulator